MQTITIKGRDPYQIFGTLYQKPDSEDSPSDKLIINVHGLTNSQWSYLQLNSIKPFNDAGYNVFNFSFYDRTPGSRRLSQSTLSSHQDDLQRVIEHFKDQYQSIYLTAHSLGGLVTLVLNPDGIKAVSFWDPSFDVTHFWAQINCLTPLKEKNAYILDYGSEFVIGTDMVDEITHYPNDKCLELAGDFKTPAQMVIPETSIFQVSPHTSPKQYDSAFKAEYERLDIDKTDHCFYGPNKDQELFKNTVSWFSRFS